MNTFTAKDFKAADLLALARLDDDGAPCCSGLSRPQPASPVPDMIEGSSTDARGREALRGPGQAEVRASRPSRCTRCLRGQLPDRWCYSPLVGPRGRPPCCRSRRAARRASRRAWARP
jgi:hypothetical protein